MTYIVGIYIFDEVEVLDFAGPFEVFSTASRVQGRLDPDSASPFEVVLLADRLRTVRARGGLRIQPEVEIGEYRELDILIVPGGIVTAELRREEVTDWIKEVSSRSKVTASVCTGAFLLAQAGLLEGRRATTHWEDIDNLARMFPGVDVERGVRWVDTGEVVTSAGISAGIDMSLHLVARFWGRELAEQTARQMEFDWVGKEVY